MNARKVFSQHILSMTTFKLSKNELNLLLYNIKKIKNNDVIDNLLISFLEMVLIEKNEIDKIFMTQIDKFFSTPDDLIDLLWIDINLANEKSIRGKNIFIKWLLMGNINTEDIYNLFKKNPILWNNFKNILNKLRIKIKKLNEQYNGWDLYWNIKKN